MSFTILLENISSNNEVDSEFLKMKNFWILQKSLSSRGEMHLEVEFLGSCGQAMLVPPLSNTLL